MLNGENSAGCAGITERNLRRISRLRRRRGDHRIHVWTKGGAVFIERHDRLLRPLNFPPDSPGRGTGVFKAANGASVLVVNAIGQLFMGLFDCPFAAVAKALEAAPLGEVVDASVIDFHAEATSEKHALGFHVDGRASLVIGTHTHVPTADERVLPGGTAYMTDAGMCGDYHSIIGVEVDEPLNRFVTKFRVRASRPPPDRPHSQARWLKPTKRPVSPPA